MSGASGRQLDLFAGGAEPVLSVSQLTDQVKTVLESAFPALWVSGEISNFSRPSSGHCYLTLKDDQAQLRAVLWRTTAARVRFDLHDGLEVICQGCLDLYPPRGSYQLVIQQILPKGEGALERALRVLRERLAAEGLFDAARKRPLPPFPRRVALVTSPTGAAVRDFLEILRRRWRGVDVLVVPVRVQGAGAAQEIAAAVAQVNRLAAPIDVLVVARGGGSLEDLWSFNEEAVVRAIAASRIPVVSAVGHDIDVTLADLVADVRAATPSEAAERIAPAAEEVAALVQRYRQRLEAALRARLAALRGRIDLLAAARSFRRPLERVRLLGQSLDQLQARQDRALRHRLDRARDALAAQAARLHSLSPLGVLGRGYSLSEREGQLILDAAALRPGDQMLTRFARGQATSRVETAEPARSTDHVAHERAKLGPAANPPQTGR